ncbi:transcriptional regulator, AraC family protein [alpha proteobacterium BAL199]|jgi:transcriptional regulator GlxA family with amidase domain|nr:transcriptional regulator, AraC family protein [alpha proteobacterium BAL199]
MATRLVPAVLLIRDGGFASAVVGPAEILRMAGVAPRVLAGRPARPRFRVTIASPSGGPAACVGGLTVPAEAALADTGVPDLVLVGSSGIAGMAIADADTDAAISGWLRAAYDGGAVIAGVCSGVFQLGRAGLLDGRRATTHWAFADELRRMFPAADVRPARMVLDEDRIVTAGGVNAASDLALHLVERFCGRDEARDLANALVLDLPRAAQSGYAGWLGGAAHGDDAVMRVQRVIAERPEAAAGVEGLAASVGLSPRSLARRFRAATGETVVECVQRLRVARARELLEVERLSVEQVARRVGYEDLAFFRRLFRKYTGLTPSGHRQRFGRPGAVAARGDARAAAANQSGTVVTPQIVP